MERQMLHGHLPTMVEGVEHSSRARKRRCVVADGLAEHPPVVPRGSPAGSSAEVPGVTGDTVAPPSTATSPGTYAVAHYAVQKLSYRISLLSLSILFFFLARELENDSTCIGGGGGGGGAATTPDSPPPSQTHTSQFSLSCLPAKEPRRFCGPLPQQRCPAGACLGRGSSVKHGLVSFRSPPGPPRWRICNVRRQADSRICPRQRLPPQE